MRAAEDASARRAAQEAARRAADEATKRAADDAANKRVTDELAARRATEEAARRSRPAPEAPRVDWPAETESTLILRGFTAQVDGRTILKDINLCFGRRGTFAIMGPGGSGKSSLLGILSGRNRAATGWNFSGEIQYGGGTLGTGARPAVVAQKVAQPSVRLRDYLLDDPLAGGENAARDQRLADLLEEVGLGWMQHKLDAVLGSTALPLRLADWRLLAIARELYGDPPLLCVDEPTAALEEDESKPILSLLQREGERRTLIFVTHNQQHARACSNYMVLLAGGRVQECQPTSLFFDFPISQVAQDYVRTGGCSVPMPDSREEHLEQPLWDEVTGDAQSAAASTQQPSPDDRDIAQGDADKTEDRADHEAHEPSPQLSPSQDDAEATNTDPLWLSNTPLLRVRNLDLMMSGQHVLSDVSFDVAQRGLHLMVCPDALPKRMLLRLLCGPHSRPLPYTGQLLYQGHTLQEGLEDRPETPPTDAHGAMRSSREYLGSVMSSGQLLSKSALLAHIVTLVEQAGFPELISSLDTVLCDLERHERRALDLLRCITIAPRLIILDDPLNGLTPRDAHRMSRLLRKEAQRRAILLFVTDPAPLLGGDGDLPIQISWLVDHRLRREAPRAPKRSSGNLPLDHMPPPRERAEAPSYPPAEKRDDRYQYSFERIDSTTVQRGAAGMDSGAVGTSVRSHTTPAPSLRPYAQGPRGFQWLRTHALAGMPAPGATNDLAYDLDLILGTGVTCLVTLTGDPLPSEPLRERNFTVIHCPIEDMSVPSLSAARMVCQRVAGLLSQGRAVGFHCKAGQGRTGTMLAAQLIWEGSDARSALAQVRRVDPNWVQSERQVQFLSQFADWLRG